MVIYTESNNMSDVTSYQRYIGKVKDNTKISRLDTLYPPLPTKKFSIVYADPPWHYNGKMQYDKSACSKTNPNWQRDIFVSTASFRYPTLKLDELKKLDVPSISEEDCILFMWATSPHLDQAIELGKCWGFEYKTIAFVWDKQVHNPGQYTLSYCELCLLFKKGRIPKPRGARNIKQLVSVPRTIHSEKPDVVADNIVSMFPSQGRIELFSRKQRAGWDNWGIGESDVIPSNGMLL